MKLARIGFLLLLVSLLSMSCSDDKSTNPDTETRPDTKLTLVTTAKGEELDRRVMERTGDEFVPEGNFVNGYYSPISKTTNFNLFSENPGNDENDFSFILNCSIDDLKNGTYDFMAGDSKLNQATYFSYKLSEEDYFADKVKLIITNVKYIGNETEGNYYVSGTCELDFVSELAESQTPNINMNITFTNWQLGLNKVQDEVRGKK